MDKASPNKLFLESIIRKIEMLNNNKTNLILIRDQVSQNRTKYINVTDALSCVRFDKKKRIKN